MFGLLLRCQVQTLVKKSLVANSALATFPRYFAAEKKENKVEQEAPVEETQAQKPEQVITPKNKKNAPKIKEGITYSDVGNYSFSKLGDVNYYSDDFINKNFPNGFNKDNTSEYELTDVHSILYRKPAKIVIDKMNSYTSGYNVSLPSFLCFTGDRGVGKSMCLENVYLHAKSNNWLTWKINARDITHNDVYILPMSRREGHFFAQPELSSKLLNDLLVDNKDKLKSLPLRDLYEDKYFWEKSKLGKMIKDGSYKSMSLADLVDYGINNNRDSYEVIMYVRRELAKVYEYPVCICIDDYNFLHDITTFAYDNIKVHASSLYLGHIFRAFDEPGIPAKEPSIPPLSNGFTLAATTEKHVSTYPFRECVNLGDHNITVNNLSTKEFTDYVQHLIKAKAFFRTGLHPEEYQYLSTISGNNPEELIKLAKKDTTFLSSLSPSKKFIDWMELNGKQKQFAMWFEENKYIPEPVIEVKEKVVEKKDQKEEEKQKKESIMSEKEKEKRNQKIIEQKKKEYRKMKSKK
ncbi:hypothetical protein WA158_005793 [Blastocystis sp. Blastoise]